MSRLRDQVREFHEKMGQPVRYRPEVPSEERVQLRAALVAEEFAEFMAAMFGDDALGCTAREFAREISSALAEGMRARRARPDLAKLTDALADLDYVIEGTRLEFGIDGGPIAKAVHAANMAKIGGGTDATGKIRKPEGWSPPDIEGELRKQGWTP